MLTLRKIILKNIQSHKELVLDLPPTGLICFVGNNSNGKSVTVKVTKAIISGKITNPKLRASLINRKAYAGDVIYERSDGVTLAVHLSREAASTYFVYTKPNEDSIQRYLSDKSWRSFISEFGFHYSDTRDISLNIGEDDDALLFFKTSSRANYEVIEPVLYDQAANTALDAFVQLVNSAKERKTHFTGMIANTNTVINSLHFYDTDKEVKARDKLKYYQNVLSHAYIPELPEIKGVPKVTTLNVYIPVLPTIKYPRILDISCDIPDIIPLAREIASLKDNKCPTCGRRFCEC